MKSMKRHMIWTGLLMVTLALSACGLSGEKKPPVEQARNEACEITFQGRKLSGTYNGDTVDGKKNGSGSFTGEDGSHRFQYDGEWKDDRIAGQGTLWDDQFVMHYHDAERVGIYDGELHDGEADGDGVFSAVNDDKVGYTYTGHFEKGLFNGEGKLSYDSDDYFVQTGNFYQGEYAPTLAQLMAALGTGSALPYRIPKATEEYLAGHEDLFPAAAPEDIREEKEMTVTTGRKVGQVWNDSYWGHDMTILLTWDENRENIHYILYPAERKDLAAGDGISYYSLPIAESTYTKKTGGTEPCQVHLASLITRDSGD